MVELKEIKEFLNKLSTNQNRLSYLRKLLEDIKEKKLSEEIKKLIEDIKELESVRQIEIRGKVDWSLPEGTENERRTTLERQIISIPMPEEEKKEIKIDYGLQNNADLYRGMNTEKAGLRYEGYNRRIDEGKSFIDRSESLIERRVNEQFMTGEIREARNEIMLDEPERYHALNEQRGYASLSEEIHEKERKKPKH